MPTTLSTVSSVRTCGYIGAARHETCELVFQLVVTHDTPAVDTLGDRASIPAMCYACTYAWMQHVRKDSET